MKTEIIHYQMCKLPNDKHVTNDAISAICAILNIGIDQVMDFIPDEKQKRDF
ncbi:helix-turn-helix domain-containing protein [Pyramidobacter piscolens]|uniref:helix-turn-helix domain-containing protein n=1 Tax=Pyramidobacter piscolens TaxID=638849 RepID=UPI00338ECD7C